MLLAGPYALAEPRPIEVPDTDQLGIIGPLVATGSGTNQKLVNLKTGLPSGARGPLNHSAVATAIGAEVIILQGDRGALGNIGPTGAQGPAGTPGIRGANGLNGSSGSPGNPGPAGLSAFDLWKLETGQTQATPADFFSALRGQDGTSGASGRNAEFPNRQMKGLVKSLIPGGDAWCGPGEYLVEIGRAHV